MARQFEVRGMTCASCVATVEKQVGKLEGVKSVEVNLLTHRMLVDVDAGVDDGTLLSAVRDAGYEGRLLGSEQKQAVAVSGDDIAEEEKQALWHRFRASLVFLIPLLYIAMGPMIGLPLPAMLDMSTRPLSFVLSQFLFSLPIVILNRELFFSGFRSLVKRQPNMNSLIAVGAGAAFLFGIVALFRVSEAVSTGDAELTTRYVHSLYYESAAVILTLITLGKFLEARAKGRTSQAISRLVELAPEQATVLRDGRELIIPTAEIQIGDLIVVRPGERLAVDGEIVDGRSALDESAVTGESLPVEKEAGDRVISASINGNGSFTYRATRVGEDTTLAQIIRLVQEAASSKAPIARLADRIAGIFVPVVLGIAALTFVLWMILGPNFEFALSMGISVLVISCPCALGLATPVAIMVGTGKGAEHGILIKSGEALETAHRVTTAVLDKTGTITEGRPQVTDVEVLRGSEEELLSLAAALERRSEHPLAAAILSYVEKRDLTEPALQEIEAVPGRGLRARDGDVLALTGNLAFLEESGIATTSLKPVAERLAGEGKTPLFFARDGQPLGTIAVADPIKPSSRQAIASFRSQGIKSVMLTGDNRLTAQAIAREAGIDNLQAEVLPADKAEVVRREQAEGRVVAMIGDGINDAPALAAADVGIAIGAGTDVAIESADIVLMRGDLNDASAAVDLSRATITNIRQNLFWAFFYNVIGIPVAAGVFFPLFGWQLNPMLAAGAMSLSSLFVVTNALRLKLWKPDRKLAVKEKAVEPKSPDRPLQTEAVKRDPEKEPVQKTENSTKENTMQKRTLTIDGMTCGHCQMRVQKALEASGPVTVQVDLESGTAVVEGASLPTDETLSQAVKEAGYDVTGIR